MAYEPATAGIGRSNRWQDRSNLVLAVWLFISPWVLQFGAAEPPAPGAPGSAEASAAAANATWNAWILGILVFLAAVSAIGWMEFWQERINLILGLWIFIAPWVLGFVPLGAASWDHWIVGALIFLISICNLATARRRLRVDMAHAGSKPPPPAI